jgi:predicted DNA-binding transcriptional regulator AlpA
MANSPLPSKLAAEHIGMSESWLRKTRLDGNSDGPPYCKIGKAVRYIPADLDDWLAAKRHVILELEGTA